MVRSHPADLGHVHQADVCAGVRVDVVDDSGYGFLANVRILSVCLFTLPNKRYRENFVKCSGFGQFFRKNGMESEGPDKRRYDFATVFSVQQGVTRWISRGFFLSRLSR